MRNQVIIQSLTRRDKTEMFFFPLFFWEEDFLFYVQWRILWFDGLPPTSTSCYKKSVADNHTNNFFLSFADKEKKNK